MLSAGRGSEEGGGICRVGVGDLGRAVQQGIPMLGGRGQSSLPWRFHGKGAQGSPEAGRRGGAPRKTWEGLCHPFPVQRRSSGQIVRPPW